MILRPSVNGLNYMHGETLCRLNLNRKLYLDVKSCYICGLPEPVFVITEYDGTGVNPLECKINNRWSTKDFNEADKTFAFFAKRLNKKIMDADT